MPDEGKRKVQSKGEFTLPESFRNENDISPGDHVKYKVHSRDRSKLIIEKKND
jgi:bifunctional DNA-binding transcriptional regulator/antitoxin component of YhaV-PrlF toxin-antitoxin module